MINKDEMKLINKIIFEAIKHGGNSSGPYLTNEEGLISAINDWINSKWGGDDYKVTEFTIKEGRCIWSGIHQITEKGE